MAKQSTITVFISYSHDSAEHRETVLRLSERLRRDGIKTILDQYVEGTPPEKWPRWMMDGLDSADFVLTICTETYYRRFRGHEMPGIGKGVDWEGALITQELYDARNKTCKFIPVLFNTNQQHYVPEPLRGGTYYVLDSDANYQKLYDVLLGQAGVEPGEIGEIKVKPRLKAEPLAFDAQTSPAEEDDSDTRQATIDKMVTDMHEVIIKHVSAILSSNSLLLTELIKEMQLDVAASAHELAKRLVLDEHAGHAIRQLAAATSVVEKKLTASSEKRAELLDSAEQMCGWFLLNTVNSEWWWLKQQQTQSGAQKSVTQSLALENPSYVEVVISHNLLQQAKFNLNEFGDLIPENDAATPYLFDATSTYASDIQLLSEIYKDLRRSPQAPQNVDVLIQKIALTAKNTVETTRKGKLIYYVMTKAYLDSLQAMDCFADLQKQLAGSVQFICCNAEGLSAPSASKEDQELLLETVASIYRLRNAKR